ncbi:MAG: Leucine-, isoleucine-, valine-, threonine-, and alanine-binding protein [Herbaspirillum frisingense]|uniref:Leucine-, isoleucine-, valine-, threonine-, and alanine-binding protein n=1 Tax=Herbaspirillum frisingense TaxID=92645 RepID=A0A7V8JU19_9BURK|nr:MAG: Leucine-, isoleucine-, valine-, threonine-, and alanine-binding protein [Herbaspirillum frisingense]
MFRQHQEQDRHVANATHAGAGDIPHHGRRHWLALACALALTIGGSGSALAQTTAPKTVLIGLAAPLSGASARIGKDLEYGAQLALDDANAKKPVIDGQPVQFKLLSEDDQSDPRAAVGAAQRLVDAGVVGVVGHWNTGTSIPAARVYNTAGIAQLAPASTGRQYTAQGFKTSFRLMGHDDIGGEYTGRYVVEKLKAKRIAVIDDRTAFGQGLADQFVKGVKKYGGNVVTREYVNDKTQDFSAVLTSIRGKNADVIFFGGVDAQAAPLARRIRQLGLKARLVGAGGFVSQTFLGLAGKDGEGVIALEPGLPVTDMPGGKSFDQRYQEKYKQPIELHAPFAYDAAAVLIAAIQKADSLAPARYLPVLQQIKYQGVTGQISFDGEGNLNNPAYTLFEVRQGKWAPAEILGGK